MSSLIWPNCKFYQLSSGSWQSMADLYERTSALDCVHMQGQPEESWGWKGSIFHTGFSVQSIVVYAQWIATVAQSAQDNGFTVVCSIWHMCLMLCLSNLFRLCWHVSWYLFWVWLPQWHWPNTWALVSKQWKHQSNMQRSMHAHSTNASLYSNNIQPSQENCLAHCRCWRQRHGSFGAAHCGETCERGFLLDGKKRSSIGQQLSLVFML